MDTKFHLRDVAVVKYQKAYIPPNYNRLGAGRVESKTFLNQICLYFLVGLFLLNLFQLWLQIFVTFLISI